MRIAGTRGGLEPKGFFACVMLLCCQCSATTDTHSQTPKEPTKEINILHRTFVVPSSSVLIDLGSRYEIDWNKMELFVDEGAMSPEKVARLMAGYDAKFDTTTQFKRVFYGKNEDRHSSFLIETSLEKDTILSPGFYLYTSLTCDPGSASLSDEQAIDDIFSAYIRRTVRTDYNN